MTDDHADVRAATTDRTVDDCAALIRQLVRSLRKAAPTNDLAGRAMDYLKRKGLQGSPLREAPDTPDIVERLRSRKWEDRQHLKLRAEAADTIEQLRANEREGWRYADELERDRKLLAQEVEQLRALLAQARPIVSAVGKHSYPDCDCDLCYLLARIDAAIARVKGG